MAGNENAFKDTLTTYGIDGRNSLWSLLGADDERRPETDPFDLGLSLESPDIQRWADEEGWTDVMDSAVKHDSGWESDVEVAERETDKNMQANSTQRKQPERMVKKRKTKAVPRSIRNVKCGLDLDFHELEVQTRWPWSLHWSLEDALFTKRLFATTIKEIERWVDWQGRRGMGTELEDREEADLCENEWYVFSVANKWFSIAHRCYIPIAIKDIITVAIETRHTTTVKLTNEEMERCIAKWRGLPVSYHNDQLNLADLGCSLQENTWRSCLQLGGLLTLQEADAIQALILASAAQAGETLNLHDWESAYILNWRDNEFSHHKDILRTVKNATANITLPFPITSNWNRTVSSWSILDDKVIDATGALERWCVQKWGAGNMGEWTDLQAEKTTHLRHADKLLFWAKRA